MWKRADQESRVDLQNGRHAHALDVELPANGAEAILIGGLEEGGRPPGGQGRGHRVVDGGVLDGGEPLDGARDRFSELTIRGQVIGDPGPQGGHCDGFGLRAGHHDDGEIPLTLAQADDQFDPAHVGEAIGDKAEVIWDVRCPSEGVLSGGDVLGPRHVGRADGLAELIRQTRVGLGKQRRQHGTRLSVQWRAGVDRVTRASVLQPSTITAPAVGGVRPRPDTLISNTTGIRAPRPQPHGSGNSRGRSAILLALIVTVLTHDAR